jgi:hypothetical protein
MLPSLPHAVTSSSKLHARRRPPPPTACPGDARTGASQSSLTSRSTTALLLRNAMPSSTSEAPKLHCAVMPPSANTSWPMSADVMMFEPAFTTLGAQSANRHVSLRPAPCGSDARSPQPSRRAAARECNTQASARWPRRARRSTRLAAPDRAANQTQPARPSSPLSAPCAWRAPFSCEHAQPTNQPSTPTLPNPPALAASTPEVTAYTRPRSAPLCIGHNPPAAVRSSAAQAAFGTSEAADAGKRGGVQASATTICSDALRRPTC